MTPRNTHSSDHTEDRPERINSFRALWLVGWLIVAGIFAGRGLKQLQAPDAPVVLARAEFKAPTPKRSPATKKIEDVQAGDYVLARDEHDPNAPLLPKRVEAKFINRADHLRLLDVRFLDGTEQRIKTTDSHPFWTTDKGWVDAGDLKIGQRVTQPDGTPAVVVGSLLEPHPEGITVFNFRVADSHTYFVSAENSTGPPVWVHNSLCGNANPIRPGDVTTYADFRSRSVTGDSIQGHELIQFAWLRHNGHASSRGGANPVIALGDALHQRVNALQAARGLHDVSVYGRMTRTQMIRANMDVLRQAGLSESKIQELRAMAVRFARGLR